MLEQVRHSRVQYRPRATEREIASHTPHPRFARREDER